MWKHKKHMMAAIILATIFWIAIFYIEFGSNIYSVLTLKRVLGSIVGVLITSILFFIFIDLFDLILIREIKGLFDDFKEGNPKTKIIIIISALLVGMRLLVSKI